MAPVSKAEIEYIKHNRNQRVRRYQPLDTALVDRHDVELGVDKRLH